jgi:hypothetical protein
MRPAILPGFTHDNMLGAPQLAIVIGDFLT